MSLGLVGRKIGMTRLFTDDGDAVPVTVVDVSNNRVTQIKTPETDGYAAVQVTFGKRRASRVSKPAAGHFAKAAVEAGHILREFRVEPDQLTSLKVGGQVGVDIFKVGQFVDVTGAVELPAGTEMVMPGDNVAITVQLIQPIAMEEGLRFAIREGGRTVGAGVVSKVIE